MSKKIRRMINYLPPISHYNNNTGLAISILLLILPMPNAPPKHKNHPTLHTQIVSKELVDVLRTRLLRREFSSRDPVTQPRQRSFCPLLQNRVFGHSETIAADIQPLKSTWSTEQTDSGVQTVDIIATTIQHSQASDSVG